ncbi:MAG: fibro-slime domain-containing protein [Deltaproteobacteria bacterium]|nr:fibro-slime domain-containing protein [Deltaproteobacteria bacterium]
MRLNRLSLIAVGFGLLACGTGGKSGDTGKGGGSSAGGEAGGAGAGDATGGGDAKGGTGGSRKGGTGGTVSTGGSGGGTNKGGTGGTMATGGTGGTSPEACAMPDFTGVVRDFTDKHPDFEPVGGPDGSEMIGAVKPELDADGKPVWALPGGYVEPISNVTLVKGKESFAQWFRDTPEFNMSAEHKLGAVTQQNGSVLIGTQDFRPIDGKLFGNKDVTKQTIDGDDGRNQLFTYELIVEFEYQATGKELLIVGSDDDSWVFVNKKLAIDNGGLHGISVGNVPFMTRAAEFGLEKGKRYQLHFFMADRNLTGAAFLMTAVGMKFTNCKPIMPVK